MNYFSLILSPTLTLDSKSFLFSLKKKGSAVICLCLKSFWTGIFVQINKYLQSRFPHNREHLGKSQVRDVCGTRMTTYRSSFLPVN